MTLTIGVDIGGTKVLGGVVDADGKVLTEARRDTPAKDVAATLDRIVDVVKELSAAHADVEAIGIGAAGWIDEARSRVLFAPNLAWRDEPLRDAIASRVHLPVVVENDANVAAWAEFRFGAGRDVESLVLLTIGTGIGGGIVVDGRLIRGAHGIAAELGHILVVPDGQVCGCHRRGCLEQYASGSALVRYAREAAKVNPERAEALLRRADGDPDAITGPMVTQAGQDGDPVSCAAFAEVGRWLGNGLADMVQIIDPEILVIGGGVVDAGELLMAPTRTAYIAALTARGRLPIADVRAAQMGPRAGLIGAADLARRR